MSGLSSIQLENSLLLIFSASGLPYYAFERFGMTHIAEVFTISLLIYLLSSFYLEDKYSKVSVLLISPILILSFLTRMSNFFLFLIPLIVRKFLLSSKKFDRALIKNSNFLISFLISSVSYVWIIFSIYGKFIINPQKIYSDQRTSEQLFGSLSDLPMTIIDIALSSFNVLFTFEFGIFWMSPILFYGTIYCLYQLKDYSNYACWLLFLCFAQNFVIIYLWQSAASSYGFRYLFSLVPLAFFVLFLQQNNEYVMKYLTIFSLFSIVGILFFETTTLTQLSLVDEYNSFGRYIRYIEPEYVKGVVLAVSDFNSYLIIFSTSYVVINIISHYKKISYYICRVFINSLISGFIKLYTTRIIIIICNIIKSCFTSFYIYYSSIGHKCLLRTSFR